jgi:predicted dehydrogenase
MVGHLLLFHPGLRAVKRLIESGELGKLFYLYGNRQNLGKVRADENALWSLGAHDIAVLLDLVGERPTELQARGECYVRPGVEDVVFGYLKFPSGVVAHLHLSWLDPNKMRRLTVVGSDKMVVFDDMESDRKVTVYDKGINLPRADTYGEYVAVRSGDISIPRVSSDEPLRLEVEEFAAAIRERRAPVSDGSSGIAVVEVLAGLQRSLDEGGAVVTVDPSLA